MRQLQRAITFLEELQECQKRPTKYGIIDAQELIKSQLDDVIDGLKQLQNDLDMNQGYAIINLPQGKRAIVDREDLDKVKKYKWLYSNSGYAIAHTKDSSGNKIRLFMHRLLVNAPNDKEVDHISGDTLDNRKSNLRICTHAQNMLNKRSYRNSSSRFKGVSWVKKPRKWRARIIRDRIVHHLGYFESEVEAAKAYNEAAKTIHGEYARLNEI